MKNIKDLPISIQKELKNQIPVKKAWLSPEVTEIPKFVILGGGNPKPAESTTDLLSF